MFFKLVHKEILLHLREARFAWITGLFCLIVVSGMILMNSEYSGRLSTYQTSLAAEQRQLLAFDRTAEIRDQVLELTNSRGIYAFRPPSPLSFLAGGFDRHLPSQIHVLDRASWARQANDHTYENPLVSLFPSPDFSFIVSTILSLVALFFTFDSICGEKNTGTLRILFSNSVSRAVVLATKWVGAMLTLSIPFLLSTLVAVAGFAISGNGSLYGDNLVRIGSIFALGVIYLSLFVTLGLAVSVTFKKPETALLVGLALWAISTFVLPEKLGTLANLVAPTPAYQQVRLKQRLLNREVNNQNLRMGRRVSAGELTQEERRKRRTISETKSARVFGGISNAKQNSAALYPD